MSSPSLRTLKIAVSLGVLALVAVALYIPLWRASPRLHGLEDAAIAAHDHEADEPVACAVGSRPGPAGESPSEATAEGIRYIVKTPANYDATRAHSLIVVFAAHGVGRSFMERYVGLTREATEKGFVVAYADSRRLDRRAIEELARIPEDVARRWCIDPRRVYFTGHSDGGTVATAITVFGKAKLMPAAIAPSAAGFRGKDLAPLACPPPVAVMVLHNQRDEHFAGWGHEAADWWAACNGCGATPETRADGCLVYPGCRSGGTTLYCESEGRHVDWPERNPAMLEFFRSTTP